MDGPGVGPRVVCCDGSAVGRCVSVAVVEVRVVKVPVATVGIVGIVEAALESPWAQHSFGHTVATRGPAK